MNAIEVRIRANMEMRRTEILVKGFTLVPFDVSERLRLESSDKEIIPTGANF